MTPDELRALADALHWVQYTADWQACDQAADYLRAQADAHPAPAVPAGWKLVPVEPTEEMLDAGYFTNHGANRGIYRAMLAAAPAAPARPDPQMARDSAELRRLCAARDAERKARREAQVQVAALKEEVARLEPMRQRAADIARLTAECERLRAAAPAQAQPLTAKQSRHPLCDSMGIPLSCRGPLCSPTLHHRLCKRFGMNDAIESSNGIGQPAGKGGTE